MIATLRKVTRFYIDGFREMTIGKTLWTIILIKLFLLFVVIKLLFMPSAMAGKSADERSHHVLYELTQEP